jgi:hypothetical protein
VGRGGVGARAQAPLHKVQRRIACGETRRFDRQGPHARARARKHAFWRKVRHGNLGEDFSVGAAAVRELSPPVDFLINRRCGADFLIHGPSGASTSCAARPGAPNLAGGPRDRLSRQGASRCTSTLTLVWQVRLLGRASVLGTARRVGRGWDLDRGSDRLAWCCAGESEREQVHALVDRG